MKVLIKSETVLPRPEVSSVMFHPHQTSSLMKVECKWWNSQLFKGWFIEMNPKQIKILLDSQNVADERGLYSSVFISWRLSAGSVCFIILARLRRRIVWHNWKFSKVTTSDSISENCRVEIEKGESILTDLLKIATAVSGSIAFCPPPVTSIPLLSSCLESSLCWFHHWTGWQWGYKK